MLKGFNKQIACEPFDSQAIHAEVKSGFAVIAEKHKLKGLKVLVGNADSSVYYQVNADNRAINAGDTIYLYAEAYKLGWAKKVYEIDGMSFILVPEDTIVLVDKPAYVPPYASIHNTSGYIVPTIMNPPNLGPIITWQNIPVDPTYKGEF